MYPSSSIPNGGQEKRTRKSDKVLQSESSGDRLKKSYVRARTLYQCIQEGKLERYSPAKKYDGNNAEGEAYSVSVWDKVARELSKLNIDAEDYVAAVFVSLLGKDQAIPQPAQLSHVNWLEAYAAHVASYATELEDSLGTQKQIARREISCELSYGVSTTPVAATLKVLQQPMPALTPLFLYCLNETVPSDKQELIREHYFAAAAMQYSPSARFYDEAWKTDIPKEFQAKAKNWYQKF